MKEIKVFNIGRTQVDKEEVRRWLDYLKVSNEFTIPDEEIISNPALLIALAAKRCYMSFEPGLNPNVTKVRKIWTEYLDNILASGHGSVLEHSVYNFAIEGVTRVFTGEMNRHRAGVAISEGSMRYIRFDNIEYWLPDSLKNDASDTPDLFIKKKRSQEVFERAFKQAEENYKELNEIWEIDSIQSFETKKIITSRNRRVVPMGVSTGGIWSMNLRAVRHILALRANPYAEEEICHVFTTIGKIIVMKEPALFADFECLIDKYWVPRYKKV